MMIEDLGVGMNHSIFSFLQKMGKSFMLPIAVLPIAGIFLGLGSSLTNATTISALHAESILSQGTLLYSFLLLLKTTGKVLFDNLPLIFAVSIALGMAKQRKEVAALSAIIAFFVMHATINSLLILDGTIVNDVVSSRVLDGSITWVCGLQSLEMGVFGGIIVGLGVSALHNRFYQIQLPSIISFFEGERFVPIICAIAYLFVGIVLRFVWPPIQMEVYNLGQLVTSSGYVGTFLYGIIKRALVPFGLHHVWYTPFYQSALGGAKVVNGTFVTGAQIIFFAELSDPSIKHFSVEETKFFSGEFIFMIFGLPGACLAMYQCAKPEAKKKVGGLLLSAALTSMLTGITEPVEFSFLFAAPLLFAVHVFLAATCFVMAQFFRIAIGFTFSAGFVDFFLFGIIQGNAKTNWIMVVVLGIIYFFIYYFAFRTIILKFDCKTPGREDDNVMKVFDKKKLDFTFDQSLIDPRSQMIIQGLGGRSNFYDLDCCITRLRASLRNPELINESLLKQSGAAGIMHKNEAIQIIYGPQASNIKSKLDEYMNAVPEAYDQQEQTISFTSGEEKKIYSVGNGEVLPIEEALDPIFSSKLIGDGVMMRLQNGLVLCPCEGKITMIYPSKHAIGITLDEDTQLLLHFGIDTAKLNGQGFELLVGLNQQVHVGDALWNADLKFIHENAIDDCLLMVFTQVKENAQIEKYYGLKTSEDCVMEVKV